MAKFFLVTLCVTASLIGAKALTELEYGMTMTDRSYGAVCWYEYLKNFPDTNSNNFMSCEGQAKNVQTQIQNPDETNAEYFKAYPEKQAEMFGDWLGSMAMVSIPTDYTTKCQKYLKDSKAEPPADESDALNDKNGNSYPFKGLAYCMMKVLREKHGEEAIKAVKDERTHKYKNWMKTLLDRDNDFRVRNGAQPFKLVKELNDAAQEWADKNAKECNMYHSANSYPGRQWNGDGTGESLSSGGGNDNNRNAAYIASDGWYEENKDYPWPAYTGDGNDAQFESIGHFTQTVWKGSKYVGYGYAYNADCTGGSNFFIAARYSPAGNMPGDFGNNVAPPQ